VHCKVAFCVALQRFEHTGSSYRGRIGSVQLPDELHGRVEAVLGLDNRPVAKPHFRRVHSPGNVHWHADTGAATSFTPLQLASLYDFPPGTGQGQCVGIIELGGGERMADLSAYFSALGISPGPKVTAISVNHGKNHPTGDPNGPDGEVMLDIEVVGAIAPNANIAVYFAPNTDAGFLYRAGVRRLLAAILLIAVARPAAADSAIGDWPLLRRRPWRRSLFAADSDRQEQCRAVEARLGIPHRRRLRRQRLEPIEPFEREGCEQIEQRHCLDGQRDVVVNVGWDLHAGEIAARQQFCSGEMICDRTCGDCEYWLRGLSAHARRAKAEQKRGAKPCEPGHFTGTFPNRCPRHWMRSRMGGGGRSRASATVPLPN
jgi:hypothetical protein